MKLRQIVLGIILLTIGFIIVKFAFPKIGIIRENIVSCIPEELSDIFDKEQADICSTLRSLTSSIMTYIFAGGIIAMIGMLFAIVGALSPERVERKSNGSRLY